MDHRPPGSSVHGILQARILEWVAMPSSRGPSRPRGWTHISFVSCIGRRVLYHYCHLGSPKWKVTPWGLGSNEMKRVWLLEDFEKHNSHTSSGPSCPDFYVRKVHFYLLELLWFRVFATYSETQYLLIHAPHSHTMRKPHVWTVRIWAVQDGEQLWWLLPLICSCPLPTLSMVLITYFVWLFYFLTHSYFPFYFLVTTISWDASSCFLFFKYSRNRSSYQIETAQVAENLIITMHEVESKGV